MLRLHRESSRSYPGRSVQPGDRKEIHKPSGENAGWGYRLTKSRRYSGRVAPTRAPHEATPEVIGQKSAEAIVANAIRTSRRMSVLHAWL
jgi:hypothetical protein